MDAWHDADAVEAMGGVLFTVHVRYRRVWRVRLALWILRRAILLASRLGGLGFRLIEQEEPE